MPRDIRGYYRRQADAIFDLQMREAIVRWTNERVSDEEIARRLGQTVPTIKRYRTRSLARSRSRAEIQNTFGAVPALPEPEQMPARKTHRRNGTGPGPAPGIMSDPARYRQARKRRVFWPDETVHTPARLGPGSGPGAREPTSPASPGPGPDDPLHSEPGWTPPRYTSAPHFETEQPPPPPPPPPYTTSSGEVLDPPDLIQLRKDCLQLRKAMMPFDQMATVLRITEEEARKHTYEAIAELERSEMLNADLHRRLMIEQIDQMIQAIHPMSTGLSLQHGRVPIVLEAIDRMLKLMKQKAELQGLTTPPAADIRIRLQELADREGYDILEVEEIARDVLTSHKLKLPEFRG